MNRIAWKDYGLLLSVCLVITGCSLKKYETVDGKKVPLEKLRRVEPLVLEPEPSPPMEVNDVKATAAPEKMELTLEQCRSLALENNLHLRTRLVDPALAAEQLNRERAKFEATFTSDIVYNNFDSPTTSTVKNDQGQVFLGNIGLTKPTESGGQVSVGFGDNRSKTNSTQSVLNPFYETGLTFSVTQPLLRNAGLQANTHSLRIASYGRQITDAQTKAQVIATIRSMDGIYWLLYAYRQELEVRKQQYALAEAQLEQTRRLVDMGERAQVELIRSEAGLADRREAIIIAGNSVRIQERLLKKFINHEALHMDGPTRIIPASEPQPLYYNLDPNVLMAQGIANRMDMLEIELRLAQDTSAIQYYRNRSLPDVGVTYTYDMGGVGATNESALEMLAHRDFIDHRFRLGLGIPLGNKAARSQLREAIYTRGQRLTSKENQEALIRLEVLDAIDNVEAAWLRIIASQENAQLQGRLAQAEQRQFEVGARTATEVLDAQAKLADAQSSEIRALADYQRALIDLAYYTGTLLGAANVDWEPVIPGQ
ncbi:TolC family protein [Planctomycetota bacterium]